MRGRRLDTCCVQSLVIQCGYAYLVNSKFSANNRQCFDFCISQMIRIYFCKEDIINVVKLLLNLHFKILIIIPYTFIFKLINLCLTSRLYILYVIISN